MPASRPSEALRALCYEHHVEMRKQGFSNGDESTGQTATHACSAPDCLVHYSVSRGYFLPSHNGNRNDLEVTPAIRCLDDGMPMYLAEIDLDKRDYRLWICPQCGGSRTHEHGLVGVASRKNQDARGERGTESQAP